MEINKIYNEDNLLTMARMPNDFIDVVLTSPPYNIIRKNSSDRGYDLYKDGMSNEDYLKWTINIFAEFNRILKTNGCVIYNMSYGNENSNLMNITISEILKNTEFVLADIIVWKKSMATPNNVSSNKLTRIVEFVYIFCRKIEYDSFFTNKKVLKQRETGQDIYENIYNFINAKNNDESNDLNKATFSSELVRKLLNIYAKKNSLIYDPFMGTGTTAKACIIENHNYIGSEISEEQVKYSQKRLLPLINQLKLF